MQPDDSRRKGMIRLLWLYQSIKPLIGETVVSELDDFGLIWRIIPAYLNPSPKVRYM